MYKKQNLSLFLLSILQYAIFLTEQLKRNWECPFQHKAEV